MIYAPNLALVNPIACNAFRMDFHTDRVFRDRLNVQAPETQKGIEYCLTNGLTEAYYLAGFKVTPIEGPLPKGRLRILVNGENEIVHEYLTSFIQDPEPEKYQWRTSLCLFPAVPIKDGGALYRSPVGFFLVNNDKIRITLHLEEPIEKAVFEIAVHGATYRSVPGSLPLLESKETKA